MKISGFTFVRNATKLFIPVKESISSILPIVDEFVIALGDSDENDTTLKEIESINSDKIRIINTVWDTDLYGKNTVYSHQTDIAKDQCCGDWLFYLQCDEVIHEHSLDNISEACRKYLEDKKVEGLLFNYKHFWGDFDHYHISHVWYPREIRIIRNDKKIHSWRDAQSFRKYSTFNYKFEDYLKSKNTRVLNVKKVESCVFHYGYVRSPELMINKKKVGSSSYYGKERAKLLIKGMPQEYDYGPLNQLALFKGSHPRVMKDWIKKFTWKNKLQYYGKRNPNRKIHKHEMLKYRIITFLEQNFLMGASLGGFKNYKIIR